MGKECDGGRVREISPGETRGGGESTREGDSRKYLLHWPLSIEML